MAETSYPYPLAGFPNGAADLASLEVEVRNSPIETALAGSILANDIVTLVFRAELSVGDQILLDGLVAAHQGNPLVEPQEVTIHGVGIENRKIQTTVEKTSTPTRTIYTHDWTDRTTWYTESQRVVGESPVPDVARTVWQLSHPFVIDLTHGKVTDEVALRSPITSASYTPIVYVAGVPQVEVDPHTEEGAYYINYQTGQITFATPIPEGTPVTVDYYYAQGSTFKVVPNPGKLLNLSQAKVQFSDDLDMRDTLIFQVYVGGYPYGPSTVFNTVRDFFVDAQRSNPLIPALGNPLNWRSSSKATLPLVWDYLGNKGFASCMGVELWLTLVHHEPFGGSYATASFYCHEEAE